MSRALLERLVALIFLVLCIAYGVAAQRIELLFGAEFSPFNARTFPTLLAGAGAVVALLILIAPQSGRADAPSQPLRWKPVAALTAAVFAYAWLIEWVGFLLASVAFLAVSCWLLGERNWRVIAGVAVGISLSLFLILDVMLDIYLDDPILRAIGLQ